jgi:pyruvate ferredoxin oxidoreductase delta subunit
MKMEKGAVIRHNIKKAAKTGDWSYMVPIIDKVKCIGCSTCTEFCPEATINMQKEKNGNKKRAEVDYYFCKGCGVCTTVCPVKAIIMKKK